MKLTAEQRAAIKAVAEGSINGRRNVSLAEETLASGYLALLVNLEEAEGALRKERIDADFRTGELMQLRVDLENEKARGIHTCHDNCTRDGCVNLRLRAELAATRKLVAARRLMEMKLHVEVLKMRDNADTYGPLGFEAVQAALQAVLVAMDEHEYGNTSALSAVIAEAVAPYKRNAERWQHARQFLSVEDIEAWSGPDWKGHEPTEGENALADAAIDAATAAKEDKHG